MPRLPLISALVAAALGGCAIQPQPIAPEVHRDRASADHQRVFAEQEPFTAPLTLAQATARAIKYNLDYRTRMMEQAATLGQLDVANWDLLPRLTANAGYTTRNNDAFGFGFTPSGQVSTSPSSAQERTRHTENITFAWNVLDFGLSYVRAKQLADQSLIAEERRRRALQNLVQDVRAAWWRAEAAERLTPAIDAMLEEIDRYTARARLIEGRKLLPPLQIVAYRRSLLDLEQQLSMKRQELAQAREELAGLLNAPSSSQFKIATQDDERPIADLAGNIPALEALALANRPELREEAYKQRLTDLEWRKQVISLLPNLGIEAGYNHDSNRFLINNTWASAGINASFGLLRAFSLPAINRSADAQKQVDESRRLAMVSAVLVQTRVAAVRYRLLTHEMGVWNEAVGDDKKITEYLQQGRDSGLETELEIVRAKARHLVSSVNRDLVYANLQNAIGRLYNSIGYDSLPREIASHETDSLARDLEHHVSTFERENFIARRSAELLPVAIGRVDGVPAEELGAFREGLARILRIARIPVATGKAAHQIEATIELEKARDGARQARMRVRVRDANNAVTEIEQKSMLLDPVTTEQWRTLGEGAAYRASEPLRKMLRPTVTAASPAVK